MARYEPGQAVEQFGDVRYDEDLVAVRKQSCLFPLSGLREGDDPAAVYSTGNALALVNTKVRGGRESPQGCCKWLANGRRGGDRAF